MDVAPRCERSARGRVLGSAARLVANQQGRVALVVCGADDLQAQTLCNALNEILGSYGETIDLGQPAHQVEGDEAQLSTLLDEIASGSVDALFVDGINPVLDFPGGADLAARLDALSLVVVEHDLDS